jgi:hypothetical protein
MDKCEFKIKHAKEVEAAKEIIENEITKNGGTVEIQENKAEFLIEIPGGKVEGSLIFDEEKLRVNIVDKPDFIPCHAIKSVIKSYL